MLRKAQDDIEIKNNILNAKLQNIKEASTQTVSERNEVSTQTISKPNKVSIQPISKLNEVLNVKE